MTKDTRQFITLITLGVIGVGLILTEAHRNILAAIWPLITDFYLTYIAF